MMTVLVLHTHVQFVPSVTELVVAQCYYLDFDDKNRSKPIYVYLNSTGCINEQGKVRMPSAWVQSEQEEQAAQQPDMSS
jgi:ATP-dependent protease ClpP protease subunit